MCLEGIDTISKAMKKHKESSKVCEQGCHTILSIVKEGKATKTQTKTNSITNTLDDGKKKAIEGETINAVLEIMKRPNENDKVCEYCCKILFSLTEGGK